MTKKRNTPEALRAKGYLPRVEAAAELRRVADSVERGLFIRTPTERPDLWVKFNLNLYYQNAEQE